MCHTGCCAALHTDGRTSIPACAACAGVQERLEAELDAAGLIVKPGAGARPLALDDLQGLKFLSACIKEAMRMFPVVSVMSRRVVGRARGVGAHLLLRLKRSTTAVQVSGRYAHARRALHGARRHPRCHPAVCHPQQRALLGGTPGVQA